MIGKRCTSLSNSNQPSYSHAVLKFLNGDKMKNASLCTRLGIAPKNAAQATTVINKTLDAALIRFTDPDHPRASYLPHWA
jgi:ATP-dependent DNA helicase RecG